MVGLESPSPCRRRPKTLTFSGLAPPRQPSFRLDPTSPPESRAGRPTDCKAMACRGAASRSFLAAVRGRASSSSSASASASRIRAAPLPSAPRRRVPAFSPFAAARPMAAMMGSPAAVAARLTGHPSANVRACCELSQGNGDDA
ncbi:uncharacterized protein LOC107303833 isoform X2 [Oryza brachyantha]|uniref:uncharacterized protein LOC107303833 isoform X2 n=2 Tax=Oryza brachyantha TaxID=4533 RepID=UPI001ADC7DAE|nr:uncharacterized protein LOC107303833 isoform X2 [Oryza brachyantha]